LRFLPDGQISCAVDRPRVQPLWQKYFCFSESKTKSASALSEAKSDGLTHPGSGTLKRIAVRPLTVY
jgi:hypothetical protein